MIFSVRILRRAPCCALAEQCVGDILNSVRVDIEGRWVTVDVTWAAWLRQLRGEA